MNAANSDLEEIAIGAYYLWEAAGRPNGRAVEHWLEAESQLRAAQEDVKNIPSAAKTGHMDGARDRDVRYGLVLRSKRESSPSWDKL